ncbi:MAG: hypothetical protein SWY16_09470 [Cyanobacteriota bacterium]|nr:hypothetical protein [Cyanobacteriota bacterium]
MSTHSSDTPSIRPTPEMAIADIPIGTLDRDRFLRWVYSLKIEKRCLSKIGKSPTNIGNFLPSEDSIELL